MQNISTTALAILESGSFVGVSMACSNGLTITHDNIIQGTFVLDRNSVSGNMIEIGNAETTELSFTLDNHDGRYSPYAFAGHTLTVDLMLGEESLRVGIFTIDNSPKKLSTLKIFALDNMSKFNKTFVQPEASSLGSLLEHCCSRCGVVLNTTTFTNSNRTVNIPTTKTTYHRVVGWIAELAGANAYIGHDGELYLGWYGENQAVKPEISSNHRFEFEADEQSIKITGLSYYDGKTTKLLGTDTYVIAIEGNELMPSDSTAILQSIYNKIYGYTYLPYSFSTLPMPYLWPLDEITILMPDNSTRVSSIVTNHNISLNGRSRISAVGRSQQDKEYEPAPPLTPSQYVESTSILDASIAKHLEDKTNSHLSYYQKKGLTGGAERLKTISLGHSSKVSSFNSDISDDKPFSVEGEVVREHIAITTPEYWQEILVKTVPSVTSTSVTVQYDKEGIGNVYVAYVTSGTLWVRSAQFSYHTSEMEWEDVVSINGCVGCSLLYDGMFVKVGDKIEYHTELIPYLFYTTTAGELKGGVLGTTYETIVGANVTSFDAIRGVRGLMGTNHGIDEGLLVFYVLNGVVFYRPYKYGEWGDQEIVSIAPENIVNIKAERTFDWRIVLQVEDTLGKLYEVFTESYVSGNTNVEFLTAKATAMTVDVIEIEYGDYKAPDEYITARPSGMEIAVKAAVTSPYIADAWNVPVSMYNEETEEWYDDYGYNVVVKWSDAVYGFEDNLDKTYIEDDYGMKWYAQEITRLDLHNRLLIRFTNMNNAGNPVTINYDGSGSLSSGVVPVTGCSKSFSLTNLEPDYVAPPVFVSAWNYGSQTIYVEFDKPIIDIASQSGIVVSGFEPVMSPEGSLVQTTYGFDSVEHSDASLVYEFDFTDGTLDGLEVI